MAAAPSLARIFILDAVLAIEWASFSFVVANSEANRDSIVLTSIHGTFFAKPFLPLSN